MAEATVEENRPVLGWSGFIAGAAALLLALALFWGGPFGGAPEPVEGPSLVERVADAARAVAGGERTAPEPVPAAPARDFGALLNAAVAGLGGLAVILGLAGFARHEPRRPAFSAVTLGGGAIVFQLVTGFILILICLLLMGSLTRGGDGAGGFFEGILEGITGVFSAIGDFFSNLFGGFFGS